MFCFWMQMNGFSVSVIAESGSYDEVKQALILKGKKNLCKRSHNLLYLNLTKMFMGCNLFTSGIVTENQSQAYDEQDDKGCPSILTLLSPAFSMLPTNVKKPSEKFLLIHLSYSTTPCWRWDKRKHFTGEEARRQIEQLCEHYYMKYVLIRLSNCWNQFHY